MAEIQAPYSSKNSPAEDLVLLVKGRYSSPRSTRQSLSLLIHVHYGVSVAHYERNQRDVLALTLQMMGEIVPSVLYKTNNIAAIFRRVAEEADKDNKVSLDDITTSLLHAIRWGAMDEAERERIQALTIDESVEDYLKNFTFVINNHTMAES